MADSTDMPQTDPTGNTPDAADADTVLVYGGGSKPRRLPRKQVERHDFRQPALLSPSELRRLRQRHDDFARSLGGILSNYLRGEFALRVTRLQTAGFQKIMEELSTPTHITLFKAEPLKGIGFLDLPPRLGLTIVERLLGGQGQETPEVRELSDIESALLDEVVALILNQWCSEWRTIQELRPSLLGHETNPRFVQTCAHDTPVLVLTLEATLGDCIESIQMALPFFTIEPIVRQIAELALANREGEAAAVARARWNPEFSQVPVTASAEWHGLELSVRALAALKPGDVLMLAPRASEQVVVSFAQTRKFHGRLGTCGRKWAVELTGKAPTS
jgi:flagellar motor switch protein FliM